LDSSLKQRLVGAAVLVALGVIFIPMLLERGTEDARMSVQMEIPPEPETRFKDHTAGNDPAEAIEPLPPIEQSAAEAGAPAGGEAAAESGQSASKAEKQPAGQAGETGAAAGEPEAEPEPEPAPASDSESGSEPGEWIVQVGSFRRQANAEVLRDKLKSGGFDAFVETAEAGTGPVYRVRIGPHARRDEAEALVERLKEQGDYQGIVMRHSP
jgi:DedD protein